MFVPIILNNMSKSYEQLHMVTLPTLIKSFIMYDYIIIIIKLLFNFVSKRL